MDTSCESAGPHTCLQLLTSLGPTRIPMSLTYSLNHLTQNANPNPIRSLFRFAVRPMLILTAISTPLFLFLSSAYAFSGSFFSSAKGVPPTWGETVGLRLFALVPLGFAYLSAKSFYQRYESLVQTASVVEVRFFNHSSWYTI